MRAAPMVAHPIPAAHGETPRFLPFSLGRTAGSLPSICPPAARCHGAGGGVGSTHLRPDKHRGPWEFDPFSRILAP